MTVKSSFAELVSLTIAIGCGQENPFLRYAALRYHSRQVKQPFAVLNMFSFSLTLLSASSHVSDGTPSEKVHITVSIANETCWAAGFARACIHVYSENEDETPGYQGWRRVSKTNNYFKGLKITDDLAKAKCHDLASYIDAEEISETPGPSGM